MRGVCAGHVWEACAACVLVGGKAEAHLIMWRRLEVAAAVQTADNQNVCLRWGQLGPSAGQGRYTVPVAAAVTSDLVPSVPGIGVETRRGQIGEGDQEIKASNAA